MVTLQQQIFRTVGTAMVVVLAAVYVTVAPRVMIGIWLFLSGALVSISYLKMRQKMFELNPLAMLSEEIDTSIVPTPHKSRVRCTVCSGLACKRHRELPPVLDVDAITIPHALDKLIAECIDLAIDQFVNGWYSALSNDDEFVNEIKVLLKHVVGVIIERVRHLDLAKFAKEELAPIVIAHIEAFLAAKTISEASSNTNNDNTVDNDRVDEEEASSNANTHTDAKDGNDDDDGNQHDTAAVYNVALKMYKGKHHVGLLSPEHYFRQLSTKILDIVLTQNAKECTGLKQLFAEVLVGYVFKPNIETLAEPHFFNLKLAELFDGNLSQIDKLTPDEAELTHLLKDVHVRLNPTSTFDHPFDDLLKDRELLAPFQKFLQESGFLESFILYRLLEIMVTEFPEEVGDEYVPNYLAHARQIYESINEGPSFLIKYCRHHKDVLPAIETCRLATTAAECKMGPYRHLYRVVRQDLDGNLRIKFLKSNKYYAVLCGHRNSARVKRATTNTSKDAKPNTKKKLTKHEIEKAQADIISLNLPPPPSAFEELHPGLVAEQKKKRGLFKKKEKRSYANDTDFKNNEERLSFSRRNSITNGEDITVSSTVLNSGPSKKDGERPRLDSASENKGHRRTPSDTVHRSLTDLPEHHFTTTDLTKRTISGPVEIKGHKRTLSDSSRRTSSLPDATTSTTTTTTITTATATASEFVDTSANNKANVLFNLSNVEISIEKAIKRHPGVREFVVYMISVRHKATSTSTPNESGVDDVGVTSKKNAAELEVKTVEASWVVERRFSEFVLLEKRLKSLHPTISVGLPKKKQFGNMDPTHILERKCALEKYIQDLLVNPAGIIYSDHRCSETICHFLDRNTVSFKQYTPSYASNNKLFKPITIKMGSQKKEDFASFLDLFLVTAEEAEQSFAIALDETKQKWDKLREVYEETKAQPGTPSWDYEPPYVETCFSVEQPTELSGLVNKITHLVHKFSERLRYGWVLQMFMGPAKLVFGATVEANITRLLRPLLTFDTAFVVDTLKLGKQLVFEPVDEPPVTPAEEARRLIELHSNLRERIPAQVMNLLPFEDVEEVCNLLIAVVQNKTYNKQLICCVLDAVIKELFPETIE